MEKTLQKANSFVQFLLFSSIFFFTQIFANAQVRTENETCVTCRIFGSAGAVVMGVLVLAAIFAVILMFLRIVRKNNGPTAPRKF